jgi:formylglycine-generating enzyme required for sulfatase activity
MPNALGGTQATGCLDVMPNPYPATGILKRQASAYCAWIGGALPTFRQWSAQASKATPKGDNFLDALTCEWTRFGRKPRDCDPKSLRASNPWDGDGWIAPAGFGSGHVLGNVREWLADRGNWAAGCSYNEALTDTCKTRREVGGHLAHDVGFRCVGGKPPPGRVKRAKTGKPSLDWEKIAGGTFTLGGTAEKPLNVLLNGPMKLDKPGMSAVAARLVGAKPKHGIALLMQLRMGGLPLTVNQHHLQELLTRGRWAGLNAHQVIEILKQFGLAKLANKQIKAIFDVHVNAEYSLERWRSKHRRDLPNNDAMSGAEKMTALYTRLLVALSRYERVPPSRTQPRFDDTKGFTCATQGRGTCVDRTGIRGSRLASDRHESRQVKLKAFELLRTEVTQAQFKRTMGFVPSFHDCPDCPVERVTWREAKTFCKRVGGRLPTEAEWEWAASNGAKHGTYLDFDDAIAWRGNTKTLPAAGSKDDNANNLHDMLGGVWEWTADAWKNGRDIAGVARYVKVPAEGAKKPFRGPSILDLRAGRKESPQGRACLYASQHHLRAEENLSKLPFRDEKKRYFACYKNAAAAVAAFDRAMSEDPKGPTFNPKEPRPPKRVLKGGSWGSDERLLTTHARVAYRGGARNDFVGFRCAK